MPSTRLSTASRLLVQAPPGQVSQVFHDLRGILLDRDAAGEDEETIDDAQIKQMGLVALEEYNTSQLIPTAIQEGQDQVIICRAGQVHASEGEAATREGKRYAHPRLKKSFVFDHMTRTASDVQDLPVDKEAEHIRAALDAALQTYVADRYTSGVSSVFTINNVPFPAKVASSSSAPAQVQEEAAKVDAQDPSVPTAAATNEAMEADDEKPTHTTEAAAEATEDDPVEAVSTHEAASSSDPTSTAETRAPPAMERKISYTFHHVGNKYHLSNFWSGRWRASYTLDPIVHTLTSSLQIQVHYFENGNVQLNASKPKTFLLPPSLFVKGDEKKLARAIVKILQEHEDDYQKTLEETYEDLDEKAFKALRRQLPLTKNKIDWNQLMNYRLGAELAKQ